MRKAVLSFVSSAALLVGRDAAADKPWVDRALTLPPLHFSADAGIGIGQYQGFSVDPNNPAAAPIPLGNKVGWGSNLEAAIGLPFVGEFGARVGYRFSDVGADAQADHYARLFDPIVNEPGSDALTNPELHLRGTLLPLEVVEVGLETRAIIPTASNCAAATSGIKASCYFALTPGIPVRIHIPGLLRVDTGLYFPIAFDPNTGFAIQMPAQAFFQIRDAFIGPLTGFRYNHPGGGVDSTTNIIAGLGGGYTLAGMVDLKGQVYTDQINGGDWAKHIGAGIGVGLRVP